MQLVLLFALTRTNTFSTKYQSNAPAEMFIIAIFSYYTLLPQKYRPNYIFKNLMGPDRGNPNLTSISNLAVF